MEKTWWQKYWGAVAIIGVIAFFVIADASISSNPPTTNAAEIAQPQQQDRTASVPATTTQTGVAAPSQSASWHVAYKYQNDTLVQTPAFAMRGSQWKITYSCSVENPSLSASYFQGYLDSASDGASVNGGIFANDVNCPTTETSYLYGQSAGQYYLNVGSSNASYSVTVEDQY